MAARRLLPAGLVAALFAVVIVGLLAAVLDATWPRLPGPSSASAQSDRPLGDTGLFRVECDGGPGVGDSPLVATKPIDPIVSPGVEDSTHFHDFFGSLGILADGAASTNDSIREYLTTCQRSDESKDLRIPLDRSLQWVPAAYQDGVKVDPERFVVTYKTQRRDPASIVPFPDDQRMIAGSSGGWDTTGARDQPSRPGVYGWSCQRGPTLDPGDIDTAPTCGEGAQLVLSLFFPDCWDGHNSDSQDHQSHMAYSVHTPAKAAQRECPESHPVAVPRVDFLIGYDTEGGEGFRLAGRDAGGHKRVSILTSHADYMFGWDEAEFAHLTEVCLRADEYCGTSRDPAPG